MTGKAILDPLEIQSLRQKETGTKKRLLAHRVFQYTVDVAV